MQVLKDEMRKRIYEAAVKEFSEKGFSRASMRGIARDAGMTVGNLYRYFKDKEALFYYVISPAHNSLVELVKECLEMVKYKFDNSFFEYLAERILKICREHKIELLILFEGSSGSRYEGAKEEMVQVVEDFLKDNLHKRFKEKSVEIEDAYLFRVIAEGFVEGMAMIAKKFDSDEKLQKVVAQFITFYFTGVVKRFE